MRFIFPCLVIFATTCLGLVQHSIAQTPVEIKLTEQNYDAWKLHINPSKAELAWLEIDWLPDLKSGIEQAAKEGKPVLLWTMNGHPFGCT